MLFYVVWYHQTVRIIDRNSSVLGTGGDYLLYLRLFVSFLNTKKENSGIVPCSWQLPFLFTSLLILSFPSIRPSKIYVVEKASLN
jgi:lipid-A-disaccharide synthase-like uncharacterized protein